MEFIEFRFRRIFSLQRTKFYWWVFVPVICITRFWSTTKSNKIYLLLIEKSSWKFHPDRLLESRWQFSKFRIVREFHVLLMSINRCIWYLQQQLLELPTSNLRKQRNDLWSDSNVELVRCKYLVSVYLNVEKKREINSCFSFKQLNICSSKKKNLPTPNSSAKIAASKNVFSSRLTKPNSKSTISRGAFVAKPFAKKNKEIFQQIFCRIRFWTNRFRFLIVRTDEQNKRSEKFHLIFDEISFLPIFSFDRFSLMKFTTLSKPLVGRNFSLARSRKRISFRSAKSCCSCSDKCGTNFLVMSPLRPPKNESRSNSDRSVFSFETWNVFVEKCSVDQRTIRINFGQDSLPSFEMNRVRINQRSIEIEQNSKHDPTSTVWKMICRDYLLLLPILSDW